ncbi:cell wall integrity and stress response component 3-like isoform X2 [Acanthaster planci]|uniref:Cell wall integrity and stress response component 3-like isoform X2 n=1 Tax=Acanthaster planci TaxID=133434 RepID=A0A8B7YDH7_ACAPL|nr:cell wall integrity and stress response component 3-like isoform X2 [Acanthaster planci]
MSPLKSSPSGGWPCGRVLEFTLITTICRLVLVLSQPQNAPGYLGCFGDCVGVFCSRALPIGPKDSDLQSSEWCFRHCLDVEPVIYKYAGLEYEYECFCGNNEDYDKFGKKPESDCQDRCKGNTDQICGDSDRISIYRISQSVCNNDIGPPTNGDHTITNPRSLSYNLNDFKLFGTRVDFSCDVGYTLHGASSIECIDTGYNNVTWSDFAPTCQAPTTTKPMTTLPTTSVYLTSNRTTPSNTETNLPSYTTDEGARDDNQTTGQLITGTVVGVVIGALLALATLVASAVFVWRNRFRKTREMNTSDIAMDTAVSTYANHTYTNHLAADTYTSEPNQGDAPPVYSEVVKERYAEEDAIFSDSSDRDTGWVDNVVYVCESYPEEIDKRSDNDGQTDHPPALTMKGKPGWVENIIYE